ncbi:MAG TPA: PKD domain-containing protein, partial [Puia sp.]|nr:PKD domain-containing protein [Puia sp.]
FLKIFPLLIIFLAGFLYTQAQFQLGENPGYYGSQYTDQQIYDLMYAGGARGARSTVSMQYYLQYGMATYEARLQYPYSTKGMKNNTFFLDATAGPVYTGQSTSTASNGARSWLPNGLYNAAFNSDGSINTSNLWAKYCYDVVQSIGPYFTYFEVWNEPDLTGSINSYEDSTQSSSSWEKVEPASGDLPNMNGTVEDYVQLCMIASQVIKKYQPNAKIATGGLGYPWFYQWFLRKGGGQWIDEVSVHFYPYFSWTTCVWTGSACGTAGFHRNSDFAVSAMLQQITNFRAIETQEKATHKPMMMTESNIPRWSYVSAANLEVFPNNKQWGSDITQRNYTIKAYAKMIQGGLDMFYLYQTGETGDSGLNDGGSGSEIDAMGMYKNLTKATPGKEVLTNQGVSIRTMQSLMGNYKLDGTQPVFPAGVDGARFDSAGNKIYVVWAITTLDMVETASGSYTLPSGTNFKKYLYDGSSPGLVSGAISLTGDPIILVQTSGTISSVNCNAGTNQTITLPTSSATLDASTSSANNSTISSYVWTQISGPNTSTISNAKTVTASAGNLIAGTYTYQVAIKDAKGDSCSSTVQVTVKAAATPPTVNAGVNQTITLPTNTASLIGIATDLSGLITGYTWTQVSGPSTATISSSALITTTVKGLVAGTYVFQLKVVDNNGLSATATVTITVNSASNQPPVADAGSNQTITLPLDSVTLNGTASKDPDGTIASYAWTQISGPSTGTIRTASGSTTIATNLIQGTYLFKLTVKDNSGATDADTVTITVNAAANEPPVANAGTSQTITLPKNSTSLNGSASSDPDGTIVSYSWTELSGTSTATITGGTTATPTVSGLVAGTYTFQLTVTDNSGVTAKASVKITVVAAANQPPVANAGANQTITLPLDSVTLNGSASSDPDGTISSYAWTQISGPSTGTIRSAESVTTIATDLVQGTYSFKLTVKDNGGATDVDTVNIIVNAAVNLPPIANAGPSQTITLPTSTTTLDGTASSDPDGTIASYVWTELSGPSTATITGGTTAIPSLSGLTVAGRYTFQLTVTDNNGATSKASVRITVVAAANTNPIANAGADQAITLPVNSVTVDGSSSIDPGGTITQYLWTISGPAGSSITNSGSVKTTITNLVQGTYQVVLTITDNTSNTSSDTMNIVVNVAANKPPVANAGSTQTITLPTSSATLDGSASFDPDGTIASYTWTQISGSSTATITGGTTATPTVSALVAGRYTFQLTVMDNSGASSTATVRITVVGAVNQPPTANAGANQEITLPLNSATLDGSGSEDPDGTIASYAWTEISGPSTATTTGGTTATPTVTNLIQGTYIFQLTVKDNNGATSTDEVTVVVDAAVNRAPVANAGVTQTITLPTSSASLDGSASFDPDGTIASYAWTQISGPSTATITGAATATPTVSALVAGRYMFQLTVTDNSGATAIATVRVTVLVAPNQAPVANAGVDQTISLPATSVSLDGTKSYDPDGTISSFRWTQVSGNAVTIVNSNTATPSVTGLSAGTFVMQLIVTDNDGATGTDNVKIVVRPAVNQPPVAIAGTDAILVLPTNSTTLDGSKSYDVDGRIVSYSWAQTSGPANSVIGNYNTATPTVSGLIEGQYVFQLTVTDNNGAKGTDNVTVTVASAILPPIANAGTDTTIAIPANTSILNGSASRAQSGTLMNYKWTQLSGPADATISTSDSAVTTVQGLAGGEYTFQLTVTDSYGQSANATVTVSVMSDLRTAGNAVLLYPNPAQSTINLQLTSDSTGTMSVNIYDMLGNLVQSKQTEKSQSYYNAPFDVSRLAGGVYTMQIVIGTNKPITAKFIKQ